MILQCELLEKRGTADGKVPGERGEVIANNTRLGLRASMNCYNYNEYEKDTLSFRRLYMQKRWLEIPRSRERTRGRTPARRGKGARGEGRFLTCASIHDHDPIEGHFTYRLTTYDLLVSLLIYSRQGEEEGHQALSLETYFFYLYRPSSPLKRPFCTYMHIYLPD